MNRDCSNCANYAYRNGIGGPCAGCVDHVGWREHKHPMTLAECVAADDSALSTQVGGDHYTRMKIQPMEFSMANNLDACQHTAIKYIARFRAKGGVEDLRKAQHVIDMLIEFEQARG